MAFLSTGQNPALGDNTNTLGEQTLNTDSTVLIEELTPSSPGAKNRKVLLVGPSLPHMGAEWGFENQIVTTWYPGNGVEATQQNLGPREMPSTWEGSWRRTMLGRIPAIYTDETGTDSPLINPHVLRDVLEDIGRSGQRLRVTWQVKGQSQTGSFTSGASKNNVDYKLVREGLMKSFKTPFDRLTDIRWTIEFVWASRGGTIDKVVSAKANQDAVTASNALEAAANTLIDGVNNATLKSINSLIPSSASALSLGQLEQIAKAPLKAVTAFTRSLQTNINTFRRIGQLADTIRNQPFAVANAVVDFAHNTLSITNQLADTISRTPIEQQSNKMKVASLLRAAKYFNDTTSRSLKVSRQSFNLDQQFRQSLASNAGRRTLRAGESTVTRAGDVIAVYVTKSGDTPQRVAIQFYNNPDNSIDILRANRLPTYTPTFRRGQILIIPALKDAQRNRGA